MSTTNDRNLLIQMIFTFDMEADEYIDCKHPLLSAKLNWSFPHV